MATTAPVGKRQTSLPQEGPSFGIKEMSALTETGSYERADVTGAPMPPSIVHVLSWPRGLLLFLSLINEVVGSLDHSVLVLLRRPGWNSRKRDTRIVGVENVRDPGRAKARYRYSITFVRLDSHRLRQPLP